MEDTFPPGTHISRYSRAHALLGWFLLVTILRPYPMLFADPSIVGRIVDLIWFLMAGIFLLYLFPRRQASAGGSPVLWLILIMYSTLMSLFWGTLVFSSIIMRDVYELYRAPYYLLVLILSSSMLWTKEELKRDFSRTMIISVFAMTAVSFLQMQSNIPILKTILSHMYYLKSQGFAVVSGGMFYMRNNGTFSNPNYFSLALAIMLPFLLACYPLICSSRGRFGLGMAVFLVLGMELTTGSRVGAIAVIVTVLLYFFWSWMESLRPRSRNAISPAMQDKRVLILPLIVIIILGVVVFPKLYRWQATREDFLSGGGVGGIGSFSVKMEQGIKFMSEAVARSPVFGLGPSKGEDNYLGDNQYTRYFFRYGILGFLVWCGFWIAIFFKAFGRWRRAVSQVQTTFAKAVLCVVPTFLLACVGGSFFDATQIMTLLLVLVGIAFSVSGNYDLKETKRQ